MAEPLSPSHLSGIASFTNEWSALLECASPAYDSQRVAGLLRSVDWAIGDVNWTSALLSDLTRHIHEKHQPWVDKFEPAPANCDEVSPPRRRQSTQWRASPGFGQVRPVKACGKANWQRECRCARKTFRNPARMALACSLPYRQVPANGCRSLHARTESRPANPAA